MRDLADAAAWHVLAELREAVMRHHMGAPERVGGRLGDDGAGLRLAAQREHPGDGLLVERVSVRRREEALLNAVRLMNASRYGLSNAVLTNRLDDAMKAMERAKTGILYIGRGTTGAELGKPFGGVKDSGHGREGAGLDEVTYLKQVYIDYHGKPRMAQAGADEAVQRMLEESRELGVSVFGGR